jgi:regulatory protein
LASVDSPSEPLKNAALRLLSARSRSVEELRGRLLEKGFTQKDVAGCILWLEDRGYLDDEAFARALIRDRTRFSPRSVFLLKREIAKKGVSSEVIEKAMEETMTEDGITDLDLGREAACRWVRKQGPAVREDLLRERFSPERERARKRLLGYLARRGFIGDAARAGLEEGEAEARKLGT